MDLTTATTLMDRLQVIGYLRRSLFLTWEAGSVIGPLSSQLLLMLRAPAHRVIACAQAVVIPLKVVVPSGTTNMISGTKMYVNTHLAYLNNTSPL